MDVLCEVFSRVAICFLLALDTPDSPISLTVVRVVREYSPTPSFCGHSSLTLQHSTRRTC